MKPLVTTLLLLLTALTIWADEEPSSKKGIGLAGKDTKEAEKKINSLNVGWHYNWTPEWMGRNFRNSPFVPMFFGDNAWSRAGIDKQKVTKSKMASSPLLGYNEPDQKEQGNLSVEKALDLWPVLEKTNRRLGSPAAVHPDNEWMKAFMDGARKKNLRVDFICVHWYGARDPDRFIKRIEEIHALYQKPVWITEFSIADWSANSVKDNAHSTADVLEFMKAVLPRLEQLPFVERYAWFSASPDHPKLGTSALFDKSGNLTELGKFYSSFSK